MKLNEGTVASPFPIHNPVVSALRRKITGFSRKITDAVLSVLLAPVCAACGQPLDEPTHGSVCQSCWRAITLFTHPLCEVCGDPVLSWRTTGAALDTCPRCRDRNHLVARGRAIGEYDGSLRSIVHALKYDSRKSLARPLASLMTACGSSVLAHADVAVP